MTAEDKNETATGSLAKGQRWSASRKREVVLRMLRGESVDALSRELNIEIYRLQNPRGSGVALPHLHINYIS